MQEHAWFAEEEGGGGGGSGGGGGGLRFWAAMARGEVVSPHRAMCRARLAALRATPPAHWAPLHDDEDEGGDGGDGGDGGGAAQAHWDHPLFDAF